MRDTSSRTLDFSARGLTKSYGQGPDRVQVLQDLDLDLLRGEMVAITGVSGTGKSTLLHILGTLDRPDQGILTYRNEDIFKRDDASLAHFRNQSIGFVFQFHHLLPEFSALENTIIPGLIAGRKKEQLYDEASELLKKVGLGHRLEHRIGELSGGEQQRVAIARAIIMKPALLLADEPTGNLDPKTGEKVFHLIRDMNHDFGLTTVMVTHNYALANQMDRCLTLLNGRLVAADHGGLVA
ncbi:MAG: ABC transporter ATP-binding protein [Desulfurivibrio sp.]|jgi:lipoprotein-releasing system ATP-binding protein|nr:MAG: ABC transporter ATP-binding protein [Desulfurivibrio sp.]